MTDYTFTHVAFSGGTPNEDIIFGHSYFRLPTYGSIGKLDLRLVEAPDANHYVWTVKAVEEDWTALTSYSLDQQLQRVRGLDPLISELCTADFIDRLQAYASAMDSFVAQELKTRGARTSRRRRRAAWASRASQKLDARAHELTGDLKAIIHKYRSASSSV